MSVCKLYEPVYCSNFDQQVFAAKSIIHHIHRPDPVINTLSTSIDHLKPFDNVKQHVQDITSLSSIEKSQLIELLSEYHSIFSDRLGCNKLYTCRFNVSRNEPFKIRSYPIPHARIEAD